MSENKDKEVKEAKDDNEKEKTDKTKESNESREKDDKDSGSPDRRSKSPDRKENKKPRSKHHSRSPERRSRSYSRSRSRSPRRRSRGRSYSRSRSRSHSPRQSVVPSTCLGVFGLSGSTTENDLKDEFSRYGTLEKVDLIIDKRTGQSRRFAFLYYSAVDEARKAKEACNGMKLHGRNIRTDFSTTARPHSPTPGRYMGRITRPRRSPRYIPSRYERRERYDYYDDRDRYYRGRDRYYDDRDRYYDRDRYDDYYDRRERY